jgi:hypothetical protein
MHSALELRQMQLADPGLAWSVVESLSPDRVLDLL